jgi:para-nitrobenzyl esterase
VKPRTLKESEDLGTRFFEYIGVKSLDEARKLDAFELLKLYSKFAGGIPLMLTSMDGKFCVGKPLSLYMQNKNARVPLMSGNTSDEFLNSITANSEEEYIKKVNELFGERAEEFLKLEEAWKKEGNKYAPVSGLECTIKSLFEHIQEDETSPKAYYYRFDTDIPGWDNPGNFHSVDLWFFFETLAKCWRPFKGKHYDLARQMCNYWCNFIKNGDPNGKDNDGTDLPYWGPYTNKKPCGMIFSTEGAVPEEKEVTKFEKFIIDSITEDLMK